MHVQHIRHVKGPAIDIIKDDIAVHGVSEDRKAALNSTGLYAVGREVLERFPVIRRVDEDVGFPAVIGIGIRSVISADQICVFHAIDFDDRSLAVTSLSERSFYDRDEMIFQIRIQKFALIADEI